MTDKAVNTQEEAAAACAAGTLSAEDMMRFARAQDPPGPPDGTLRSVTDDEVAGVPVRIYEQQGTPAALVVYYHGGGFTVADRLRAAGVKTEHIVYPGQPHGFMNLMGDMEAADDAFGKIGGWMRMLLSPSSER